MNVLVTGGGTVAPIDDVRSITNTSSGRFSAAITEACLRRGASVWHVHAPRAVLPYSRASGLDLDTDEDAAAAELARLQHLWREYRSVRDRLHLIPLVDGTVGDYSSTLERTTESTLFDVAFLAMAVSDYEPEPVAGKIDSGRESFVIRCRRTPKVIRSVRDWAPGCFLVGFKLLSGVSTEELIRRAGDAALETRADLTVANDQRTLREGRHAIHLVRTGQPPETLGPGESMAGDLVERVFTLVANRNPQSLWRSRPPG